MLVLNFFSKNWKTIVIIIGAMFLAHLCTKKVEFGVDPRDAYIDSLANASQKHLELVEKNKKIAQAWEDSATQRDIVIAEIQSDRDSADRAHNAQITHIKSLDPDIDSAAIFQSIVSRYPPEITMNQIVQRIAVELVEKDSVVTHSESLASEIVELEHKNIALSEANLSKDDVITGLEMVVGNYIEQTRILTDQRNEARKGWKKAKRGNKIWKGVAVVGTVTGLILGGLAAGGR